MHGWPKDRAAAGQNPCLSVAAGHNVLNDGLQRCALLLQICHRLCMAQDDDGAVVDAVVEGGAREHQAVEQRDCHAHRHAGLRWRNAEPALRKWPECHDLTGHGQAALHVSGSEPGTSHMLISVPQMLHGRVQAQYASRERQGCVRAFIVFSRWFAEWPCR